MLYAKGKSLRRLPGAGVGKFGGYFFKSQRPPSGCSLLCHYKIFFFYNFYKCLDLCFVCIS